MHEDSAPELPPIAPPSIGEEIAEEPAPLAPPPAPSLDLPPEPSVPAPPSELPSPEAPLPHPSQLVYQASQNLVSNQREKTRLGGNRANQHYP